MPRFVCPVLISLLCCSTLAAAPAPPDWPEYRGPSANGSVLVELPLKWSETENVVWKTPIPFRGWSTPAIMDGTIWLTTAEEEGHDFYVIAVDAASGKIVLNEKLFHSDTPDPLGNNVNCYASPSPVVEPGRVYVHFGSYGTACIDAKSKKVLWKRNDLPCNHYRGPGSSPFLFENLLILTFDGSDKQYTAALDTKTGVTVWNTPRSTEWKDLEPDGKPIRDGDFRKSFCTPIAIGVGGKAQLISLGASAAFSYEPRTGKELWKVHYDGHSSAPRPMFENGLVYLTTGHGPTQLWAVRPDGQGDVTDTHVAWKYTGKNIPSEPSMVLVDGLIYMIGNESTVTCLDSKDGSVVWTQRLGGNYMASLLHAGGRIYAFSTQGKTPVFKAGRAYESLGENTLEEGFMASPAVTGKALILRTKTALYRIENK